MDLFLLVVICVSVAINFISSLYFLTYYQHPDDRNTAYFPKFVIIGAFMIAACTMFILPLDVANNDGYGGCIGLDTSLCGGLNMRLLWDVVFWSILVWIFVLIPFSSFFYEAEVPPAVVEPPAQETPIDSSNASGGDENVAKKVQPKKPRSRFRQAMYNLIVLLSIVVAIFVVAYIKLATSYIPVKTYTGPSIINVARPAGVVYRIRPRYENNDPDDHPKLFNPFLDLEKIQHNDEILSRFVVEEKDHASHSVPVKVDVSTFFTALMSFIGWFFFSLFGGIGMIALPLEGILTYIRRHGNIILTQEEMDNLQSKLQQRIEDMVKVGEQLKRERHDKTSIKAAKAKTKQQIKQRIAEENEENGTNIKNKSIKSKIKKLFPALFEKRSATVREFKAAVYLLEKETEDYVTYCGNSKQANEKYNPLIPYLALMYGCISAIFTLGWFFHTVVYTLPTKPYYGYLNNAFIWLDSFFPLLGILGVALHMLYLLLCAVKGCFLFGLRFLCLSIYPMEVGHTYMSSFLFNMGLILVLVPPIVQFSVRSFDDYSINSTIHQTYAVEIEYLHFFSYFFENNVFVYMLLITMVVSGIFIVWRFKSETSETERLQERLKARAGLTSTEQENHIISGMKTLEDSKKEGDGEEDEDARSSSTTSSTDPYSDNNKNIFGRIRRLGQSGTSSERARLNGGGKLTPFKKRNLLGRRNKDDQEEEEEEEETPMGVNANYTESLFFEDEPLLDKTSKAGGGGGGANDGDASSESSAEDERSQYS